MVKIPIKIEERIQNIHKELQDLQAEQAELANELSSEMICSEKFENMNLHLLVLLPYTNGHTVASADSLPQLQERIGDLVAVQSDDDKLIPELEEQSEMLSAQRDELMMLLEDDQFAAMLNEEIKAITNQRALIAEEREGLKDQIKQSKNIIEKNNSTMKKLNNE